MDVEENNKTGVINDPPGQPTVPAGSEDLFCFGRFWKVYTEGGMDNMCEYSRPRGSIYTKIRMHLALKKIINKHSSFEKMLHGSVGSLNLQDLSLYN